MLDGQRRSRAEELERTFTASDLSRLLADHEARHVRQLARIARLERALWSIANGRWTAEGAVAEARKGLDGEQ